MEPRFYTNKLISILDELGSLNHVVAELLNQMSDDEVKDFAYTYGYFDDEDYDEPEYCGDAADPDNYDNYPVDVEGICQHIMSVMGCYDDSVEVVTYDDVKSDWSYLTLITNDKDLDRYDFHSDYWGSATGYREDNKTAFGVILPYINRQVTVEGEPAILKGMLIDRQYNSLAHTKILVKKIKKDDSES